MIKWYNKILDKIRQNQYEYLFIKDEAGLMNSEDLRSQIKEFYPVIYEYSGEIDLRMFIRKTVGPVLVIIKEEMYFPSDLASKYPIIEIDFSDVFPDLDETALDWLSVTEIQELFHIDQLSDKRYKKLDYQDTLGFVLKNLYEIDIPINRKEQIISFLIKYYFVNSELSGALQ